MVKPASRDRPFQIGGSTGAIYSRSNTRMPWGFALTDRALSHRQGLKILGKLDLPGARLAFGFLCDFQTDKPSCSFYGFLFTPRLVYEDPEENGDDSRDDEKSDKLRVH